MKKTTMRVIAAVLAVVMALAIGFSMVRTTDTYKKYKLAGIARSKGATDITIEDDSVTYRLDGSHMTYYSFDYGIKELSSK